MSKFFSPRVVETLRHVDAEQVLAPREADISVLFCDVRGFSRKAEQARHCLLDLLGRVSMALGVMTRGIMRNEGVIADFQGDAALAFWGWPTALLDGPIPACRAALAMHAEFISANETEGHALAGFQVGIGIGHGRAVAGKIGSDEQAKVGVFGPVVNLSARLESMTRQFHVPILIDEATAEFVRNCMPPEEASCRRLGRVRPKGIDTPVAVSQLLPPHDQPGGLTAEYIGRYESGVDAFLTGDWAGAREIFSACPASDAASTLLTDYMEQHSGVVPPGWDGVIALTNK